MGGQHPEAVGGRGELGVRGRVKTPPRDSSAPAAGQPREGALERVEGERVEAGAGAGARPRMGARIKSRVRVRVGAGRGAPRQPLQEPRRQRDVGAGRRQGPARRARRQVVQLEVVVVAVGLALRGTALASRGARGHSGKAWAGAPLHALPRARPHPPCVVWAASSRPLVSGRALFLLLSYRFFSLLPVSFP